MARKPEPENYKTIPALAAYIDRVGAEQLNFRRFMVKEHKGNYYTEKSLIIIKPDNSIFSSKKEFAPTEEELKAIREALAKIEWPKAIGARNIDALLKDNPKSKKENFYEFLSRKDNTITMVQERRENADGSKSYIPWTYFSDGQWRAMEPDGMLPFWKPSKRRSAKIMVHEGAKAARAIDALINGKTDGAKDHPWLDELSEYEHWGMIGGALAPHRAAYEELSREKPIEIVYVCDNDWTGKKAIEGVSSGWGSNLKGVFFDARWPAGWDLADEFTSEKCPALFAKKTGRYIGPSLKSLMFSATFATEQVPNPLDKGKHITVMRKSFMEEWFHIVQPEVFIHRDRPNREFSMNEFNNIVRPFSNVQETGNVLKKDAVHKSGNLCYIAAKPPGIFNDRDGNTMINMHVPTNVKPEKGKVDLWMTYLNFMFPITEDREQVMRWCATLIARPDTKMHYGMLLISETQGVGKTTLGQDILGPLVGTSNVSYPSEQDIVDSQFNYWSAQKRLAIVNEIYAGHSSKAYDKLKSIVTDKTITVNKKYQAGYQIENWLHIFACSNSFRALKISDDDRRWFIPRVTEKKQVVGWWEEFHEWLEQDNGLGKIMQWAQEFGKKNEYVKKGEAAPWSSVKREVIEESMSAGMLLVSETLDAILATAKGKPVFVTDMQLVQLIKDKLYDGRPTDKLEKPLTLRKLARSKGWFIGEKAAQFKDWGAGSLNKKRLIFSDAGQALLDPAELFKRGEKPFDLSEVEEF